MNIIIKHVEIIERIDQFIRLQATGSPEELASRLRISRTKLYRIIDIMKKLNAPIEYDISIQSYVYAEDVGFRFGFYSKKKNINRLNSSVS
ncbi:MULTISPECIES: type I-E CRISPR-associated protein Cse2/CasB [Aquimarina]|uniref:type I-E CRISPR-associated protein Cse2/CasB n=1 Tax=Aquimarina TaxID=290174 RepID=UPI000D6922BB|nr:MULTISPECIES: type I-E CRISPR-associated protein Cse2/CasB [Aquimarina]